VNWHLLAESAPSSGTPEGGTALLATVETVDDAIAAESAGARLIDVGDAGPELIAAIRVRCPGLVICAGHDQADVVRDRELAARTGAGLICASVAQAEQAAAAGVPAGRIVVTAVPATLDEITNAGWATLTDVDSCAGGLGLPGAEAIAAVCSWLGVAVVRTRHVQQIARSLDMAASILGTRPPAWTVRGLA
jgi:dihydropteroate synthase